MAGLYPVTVNSQVVCYAVGDKNSKLISQVIYQMRGFFVDDFSEPSIAVLGKKVDIKKVIEESGK